MPRHLDRRIELLFPVESKEARARAAQSFESLTSPEG
jgi:polyphosphate kinase